MSSLQYKIDTKENFDTITPQMPEIAHNMADAFFSICEERLKNDKSAIIDFGNVISMDMRVSNRLAQLHNSFYDADLSLACCCVQANIRSQMASHLNIVPTLDEAIDLVSMEGLERELLGEDE